ncbi:Protein farnesyltransferase/geranylgeranyltransferase type-1 subunit alpha [Sarcoptes scabiei]|uniref:Protein farnesyltransferase/geranylgeranyltransferase type-1 subunit alpha n=1 Tax=Sarcoptes scabiei TaxID=52283 RepID=A0A834R6E6_SARSC|nr:Protein farnesyltransferase/geranylgeranyltransferase type-1 subunit alpha [Sarcoptes scabiei]
MNRFEKNANNPDEIDDVYTSDDEDDFNRFEKDFIMYKDRPEWSDIEPMPQNEGDDPIFVIKYTPQYEDTYNYFRAIQVKQEYSERAFQLTTDCVRFNPCNYTVWNYRRCLLEKLNKNLMDEMTYIHKVIFENQKNYQVWEHQKFLLRVIKEKIDSKELEEIEYENIASIFKKFIRIILKQDDSKNYHAWQQLQWFIKFWNKFDDELKFSEEMIQYDFRNNSAWNHRFFVISNTTGFTDTIARDECEYTIDLIRLGPNNESSWNYLIGVVEKSKQDVDQFEWLVKICEDLYEEETKDPSKSPEISPHLLHFLFKCRGMQLKKLDKKGLNDQNDQMEYKKKYEQAMEYCEKLANEIDAIRVHYWKYQSRRFKEMFEKSFCEKKNR